MKIPAVFRLSASQESEEFISGSLGASFLSAEQLLNWSRSDGSNARRCVMKFHEEWHHPDCRVMEWYRLQTCTEFESIQHWRNIDNQFGHEFLIILLTDGSACRVERMGEGSGADAIRPTGCTAHDLIQWFSPEDHAAKRWAQGSREMIAQVDFPCTFDLLDVLAICYTIQRRRRTAVYTLQRYNCYFLCNTILVVLARRVGGWETLVTRVEWPTMIEDRLSKLKHISLQPMEELHPVDYLAVGICSLLDRNNPNPAGFILEALRSVLDGRARKSMNKRIANTLWHDHIHSAIDNSLSSFTDQAMVTILDCSNPNSTGFRLRTLIEKRNEQCYPPTGLDLRVISDTISRAFLTAFSTLAQEFEVHAQSRYDMKRLESEPPLYQRMTASICGYTIGALMPPVLVFPGVSQVANHVYRDAIKYVEELLARFHGV